MSGTDLVSSLHREVRDLRHRLWLAECDNEQLCAALSLIMDERVVPLPSYSRPAVFAVSDRARLTGL